MRETVPLPASFMIIGILGFIISALYTYTGKFTLWFGESGITWGVLFMLLSIIFFAASIISLRPTALYEEKERIERKKKELMKHKILKPHKK